jgi:hypothetical protein
MDNQELLDKIKKLKNERNLYRDRYIIDGQDLLNKISELEYDKIFYRDACRMYLLKIYKLEECINTFIEHYECFYAENNITEINKLFNEFVFDFDDI